MSTSFTKTPRTRLKRNPGRGVYDRETVFDILDAGFMCHVAYTIDGAPLVTPTAYWREGETVYWHGAAAATSLKAQASGIPVCFSVAHLDGLVMARSAFHHSVNFRSVTAYGDAEVIEDPAEKNRQLELFMERIAPGRWEEVRPPTPRELRLTTVMALRLEEVVAKVRAGDPKDDVPDYALPVWAGVIPIERKAGKPVDDGALAEGIKPRANLRKMKID